ncbi:DNA-binding transcriptional activator of the SARP family [Nonomuraea solani]|uniref:DNA-binding transcriptional activator of the SARP family n=1 Tax=Nonomuraea solani TaxID=1144553 RepID=A0A1H5W482_9ACTN|nr:BTAD domain-containing putative transcriptional regulator [Nonomuraea solani]SEF94193.1 DNA-binding transcriptional activator of the SARP family [Nonomuraea solani]
MEFRVLGPVEVRRDGNAVPVVGEKQRTLLALLVLRAGQVVPHDELLHALWGDDPPGAGRRALHNHVWSLRRLLADDVSLATSSGGYALNVPPGGSDLARFTAEVAAADAARAGGDLPAAAGRLRAALALWRGPALAGTRLEFQNAEGYTLEELRLSALTGRIDADLALGRHADLVGELRQLVTVEPLRERLRAQLMLALHRDGRRADALEQYRLTRRCFRDELGLEPGDELKRLHQAILAGDPDLLPDPVRPREADLVPRQLPADVARFTGRAHHLSVLDALLTGDGGALVITAIAGTGGVGKTALAVHWGHLRADHFPDGHLYLDLHGYSRSAPVTPAQALWQLLRGLGVPPESIPVDVDERAVLYRSAVAGRRMLIVLDNAAAADQVRPLLPGTSPSRVLITSRDSLRGLTATHGVDVIALDLLTPSEAEALLRAFLDKDLDGIGELAALCGYLPLALRLAAAHLRGAGTPVGEQVARLRAGDLLEALDFAEDPHIGVRATFALSYQALPEPVRATFRLMGLHPGRDVSLDALAAMSGQGFEATRECVEALVRAHLVSRAERRVSMHDLIREYARELAKAEGERPEVWERLLGWHTHTARAAMAHVDPDALLLTPTVPGPAGGARRFADRDAAMAWLNGERHNTVALVVHAAGHGWPVHAWQLAYVTAYYFYLGRHVDDWLATHRPALEAVQGLGDLGGETMILTTLGHALMEADQYGPFLECQRRAVELAAATNDRRMRAEAQNYVAFGLFRTGELVAALDANDEAQALYRELGDRPGELATIYLAGQIHVRLGEGHRALAYLDESLDWMRRRGGRRHDEAFALFEVCMARLGLGQVPAAREAAEQGLAIARDLADPMLEAQALHHLGQVAVRQELPLEALRLQEEALVHARRLPGRMTECMVLNGLGRTYEACGEPGEATAHFRAALEIALRINDPYELAAARAGLRVDRKPNAS